MYLVKFINELIGSIQKIIKKYQMIDHFYIKLKYVESFFRMVCHSMINN